MHKRLPAHAKKVFQGELFSVYQWEQPMYDGTTAIFEAVERPATVSVIATGKHPQNGEDVVFYALQEQPHRKHAFRCLFGGRIDAGEAPLEAIKRELKEESGMESDDWTLLLQQEGQGKLLWSHYLYVARNCKTTASQQLDGGEKIEVCAVPFAEFIHIVNQPDFRDVELKQFLFNNPNPMREMELKAALGLL